jgi:GT2 family glycosyltransferase
MTELAIIIVSYNTEKITRRCLINLKNNLKKYSISHEVVVVDNGSKDGSLIMLNNLVLNWKELKVIASSRNLGFGKANNLGLSKTNSRYVLYLNSDAIVSDVDFRDLINVFKTQKNLGALTVKVLLSNGLIDPASHRGFPTLWRSFTYFFGLEKFFINIPILNRLFGGYHLTNLNLNEIHEIDVPTGAFLLTKREVLKKIGGFDLSYFAYGEDIEMAWQIKSLGLKILYYPLWTVLHLKSMSGLKKNDEKIKKKTSFYFYDSMKIFYRKHYAKKNFWLINQLVYLGIELKKYFDNR